MEEAIMATIRKELRVKTAPAEVWDALQDVGAIHTRLAPGVVTNTVLEPGGRRVTFANGFEVFEIIVSVDADARRLAYAIVGSPNLTHHHATFTVSSDGAGSRVVWQADLLPDGAAEAVGELMAQGLNAMGGLYGPA
jgi:carbon monoxide dehydrogenase subunit G